MIMQEIIVASTGAVVTDAPCELKSDGEQSDLFISVPQASRNNWEEKLTPMASENDDWPKIRLQYFKCYF